MRPDQIKFNVEGNNKKQIDEYIKAICDNFYGETEYNYQYEAHQTVTTTAGFTFPMWRAHVDAWRKLTDEEREEMW